MTTLRKPPKSLNMLVNASNQANLTNTNNLTISQINSVFIMISPYCLEDYRLDGLDLDIRIDEEGTLWVNNQGFEAIEIMKGVNVIGVTRRCRS